MRTYAGVCRTRDGQDDLNGCKLHQLAREVRKRATVCFHRMLIGWAAASQHYFLLIWWKRSHGEVKSLAHGYTINDEAYSPCLFFPLREENIGVKPLGGEGRNK